MRSRSRTILSNRANDRKGKVSNTAGVFTAGGRLGSVQDPTERSSQLPDLRCNPPSRPAPGPSGSSACPYPYCWAGAWSQSSRKRNSL